MESAFGPLRAGPASFATLARNRGVGVPDRVVAAVVQHVVGEVALADVRPAVVVAPVRYRIRLPELVLLVPAELGRVRPRRRLVAPDAGDPGVQVEQGAVERLDLGNREIEVGLCLPEPVLDAASLEQLD